MLCMLVVAPYGLAATYDFFDTHLKDITDMLITGLHLALDGCAF